MFGPRTITTAVATVLLLEYVESAIICVTPFQHAANDFNGCFHNIPGYITESEKDGYCTNFMDQTNPEITPRVTDIEYQEDENVCFYFWSGTNPPTALTQGCCGGGLPGRRR